MNDFGSFHLMVVKMRTEKDLSFSNVNSSIEEMEC